MSHPLLVRNTEACSKVGVQILPPAAVAALGQHTREATTALPRDPSLASPFACTPAELTETREVVPATVSRTKMSATAFISANGRYVVFRSSATNLVSGDTNGRNDVFRHDPATGATTRVSVSSGGAQGGGDSGDPSISSDGRYVVFLSSASSSNLVSGDTNGVQDVYVRDMIAATTTRVSVATDGTQANGASNQTAIARYASKVAFRSVATTLVAADTNAVADVFVHDLVTGATTRASVSSAGVQGDGESLHPALSGDGSTVAFHSFAANLAAGDSNAARDVFLHQSSGATTRASLSSAGAQGSSNSQDSYLSEDGLRVAFSSTATNLVTGDTNGQQDAFVREESGASTTASYAYNGDGLRVSKTISGLSRSFTWDASGALPLLLSDGAASYIYGVGNAPLAQVTSSGTLYFHQDQLGSTRALTNGSGAVVGTFTYDAHGNRTASTGTASSPLGWAGEYRDAETGFVYLRARLYDPATGQFLSRDPIVAATRSAYGYVGGSPLNSRDPWGLDPAFTYYAQGPRPAGMSEQDWASYQAVVTGVNQQTCLEEVGYRTGVGQRAEADALEQRIASLNAWREHADAANSNPGMLSDLWSSKSFDPKVFASVVYNGAGCVAGVEAGAVAGAYTTVWLGAGATAGAVVGGAVGCVVGAADAYYTSGAVQLR